jgi:hypothetical protein
MEWEKMHYYPMSCSLHSLPFDFLSTIIVSCVVQNSQIKLDKWEKYV